MTASKRGQPTLTEPQYCSLAALWDGPSHGYGIIKATTTATDGRLKLAVATLYGVLDRMEQHGLVAVLKLFLRSLEQCPVGPAATDVLAPGATAELMDETPTSHRVDLATLAQNINACAHIPAPVLLLRRKLRHHRGLRRAHHPHCGALPPLSPANPCNRTRRHRRVPISNA